MAHKRFISILTLCLRSFIIPISASPAPFQLTPSVKQYGPDGPWWAVNVGIGTPPQFVDLLPGVSAQSNVLTQRSCSHDLVCGQGGIYNSTNSSSSINSPTTNSLRGGPLALGSIETYATLVATLDSLSLTSESSPLTDGKVLLRLSNFSFYRFSEVEQTFGNGVNYPVETGQLSLGPPNAVNTKAGNGSILPNALVTQNFTSSDSYGLHYGSANLNQPLSLWMGGFDQQRIVGPVSKQSPDNQANLPIDLLDIGIGVATGGSPFPFTSQSGLLAAQNTTIGSHVTVYMLPDLPFLSLPNSTCHAIASLLPVIYNETLDLYLWDTTASSYNPIRTSPAFLNFTFRASSSLAQNITINVPFSLLNLTLSPPLVSEDTPYFPCQPPSPGAKFSLGRAFLQAAFIGANWSNSPQWYLAQAPGPNIGSQASPVGFDSGTVTGSSNQWVDTWKDIWTPLPSGTAGPTATATATTTAPPPPGQKSSGGAIAGIVIGVLIGVGLLLAGAFIIFTRRKRQQRDLAGTAAAAAAGSKEGDFASSAGGHGQSSSPFIELPQKDAEEEKVEAELGHDDLLEMEAEYRRSVELSSDTPDRHPGHGRGGEAELESTVHDGRIAES